MYRTLNSLHKLDYSLKMDGHWKSARKVDCILEEPLSLARADNLFQEIELLTKDLEVQT